MRVPVALKVERLTRNRRVMGSIPVRDSKAFSSEKKKLEKAKYFFSLICFYYGLGASVSHVICVELFKQEVPCSIHIDFCRCVSTFLNLCSSSCNYH